MKLNKLGKTDIEISQIALGGLFVASFVAQFEDARKAVSRALDLGITHIDTAPTYGNSEEVLGKIFATEKRPFTLSTKLGGRPKPFLPQDKKCLRASLEESLRLLGRDHVDLLMIHEPDRPRQYDWWTDRLAVDGPVMEFLDEVKKEGLVRYTGIGGTTTAEMAHICSTGKFDVVLTAFNYSLLYREAEEEVIPAAVKAGMGIIVGSPLQQGALARDFSAQLADPNCFWVSKKRKEQFMELYALCRETGIPLPEMGIRFVLSNPAVASVLMGAKAPNEVEQNVKAANEGPLPADVLKRLDEIYAMVPYRPMGEPLGLGWVLGDPAKYPGQGEL